MSYSLKEVQDLSRHKYDAFVKRVSVNETMELLTEVLSDMYEHDQHHKDAEAQNTFRTKLGLPVASKSQEEVDPEEVERLQKENEQLREKVAALEKEQRELQKKLDE